MIEDQPNRVPLFILGFVVGIAWAYFLTAVIGAVVDRREGRASKGATFEGRGRPEPPDWLTSQSEAPMNLANHCSPAPRPEPKPKKQRVFIKRSPVKKRSRPVSETERIYGPPERRAFVKSLSCIAGAMAHPILAIVGIRVCGTSENAHTVNGGRGRKAGYKTIVPLCHVHHTAYDQHLAPFDNEEARAQVRACAPEVERLWNEYRASPTHSEPRE